MGFGKSDNKGSFQIPFCLCVVFLILFNDLYFQVIKVNTVNEIILCESGFAVTFEVTNIYIKPDGFGKVKGLANFCNSLKYFGCSGFFGIVANDQIIGHTIVKKCFSP